MNRSQPCTVVLTCASDEGYAPHATTMLLSALSNSPKLRFRIYYLHTPDFTERTMALVRKGLKRYASRVELSFVPVPDELVLGLPLFKLMQPGAIRPVMWYRVFLPKLIPDEPKILYLDSDMVVLSSLEPLWNTVLGDQALAAVTNPFWNNELEQGWAARCGLARREDYFNSGLLLINLDYWRAHDITARVVSHGLKNADWVRFGDQDSLVSLLHQSRIPLPPRWNVMGLIIMAPTSVEVFGRAALLEAIRSPAIVHFEGSVKPWIDPTRHPYGRIYARYAKRLPWPVIKAPWTIMDLENLLTRLSWLRLRQRVRTFRKRKVAKP